MPNLPNFKQKQKISVTFSNQLHIGEITIHERNKNRGVNQERKARKSL